MTRQFKSKAAGSRLRRSVSSTLYQNMGLMGLSQIAMRLSRLVATIVLARQLDSVEFGLAAIVLTSYELVAVFTRNGITAKVVQSDDAGLGATAQAAYWLTWIACIALLVAQFLIAVPVAIAFHQMRLIVPIAAMGLIYLVTPPCAIQCAMMQREGRMGRIAFASGTQVTVDNLLTAGFAVAGMGMWAIVLPKLIVAPIWLLVTRFGHTWRPARGRPDAAMVARWREILLFSRHVVGTELMTTLQANVDNLIVGAFLGAAALGTYYFAFNAGLGITIGLVGALGSAVYPHFCAVRSDRAALAARYRQTQLMMTAVFIPLIIAQVALAPIYVPLIFGAKWQPATPVLMLICLSALARPFAGTVSQLLKATDRPQVELRWQAAITVVLVAALLVAVPFGIVGIAFAVLIVQLVGLTAFTLLAPRALLSSANAPTKYGRRFAVVAAPA